MQEGLILCKGGTLKDVYWEYDEEKKEGSYKEADVTDQAIRRLFETCTLESGVLVKDAFLLMNREKEIFDSILGNWCEDYIDECLSVGPDELNEDIEFIDLYWAVHTDSKTTYGLNFPECGGTGYELKEDTADGMWKKGDRINWGISFSPLNELANIPLRLDNTLKVYNDNPYDKKGFMQILAEYPGPTFSLGHILFGLLWEISWHGGPEDKKERVAMTNDAMDAIKNDTEGKHIGGSFDDYLKEIGEDGLDD